VCYAGWSDLEGFAEELVLCVYLAVVCPQWRLGPARRHRRMMRNLFRDVAVLFVGTNIFESLALRDLIRFLDVDALRIRLTSIGLKGFAIRPIVEE
jgi:hypothetical protein